MVEHYPDTVKTKVQFFQELPVLGCLLQTLKTFSYSETKNVHPVI